MKKNWLLMLTGVIAYLIIVFASSYFILIPGVNQLKDANNVKELTYQEKTKLLDEINQKYNTMEEELQNKYAPSIQEINDKYLNLENQIKEKYERQTGAIDVEIGTKSAEQNQEFFANQFSQRYYALQNEISALRDKKWDLDSKEREEIQSNNTLKEQELQRIEENRTSELNRLKESKNKEIENINRQNENKESTRIKAVITIVVGCVIMLLPILYVVVIFNRLTHLRNAVKEKWSQVDVFLKQRTDLIPNIVDSIKGFTKHEKSTLTGVTKARNEALNATTREEEIVANQNLSNVTNRLLLLQEDYPELKSDSNFMNLQENLREIEDEISYARQRYNKAVLHYKNKLEMFPSNVIANLFHFEKELFFTIGEEEKENPNISFK